MPAVSPTCSITSNSQTSRLDLLLAEFLRTSSGYCFRYVHIDLVTGGMKCSPIILSQPFRGNPDYDTVADLPYDTSCLIKMTENRREVHIKSITKCRMETMYNTTCMLNKMTNSTKLSTDTLSSCVISRKEGENFISKSVVPMWVVYQFFVSVVLLRQVFLTFSSALK